MSNEELGQRITDKMDKEFPIQIGRKGIDNFALKYPNGYEQPFLTEEEYNRLDKLYPIPTKEELKDIYKSMGITEEWVKEITKNRKKVTERFLD